MWQQKSHRQDMNLNIQMDIHTLLDIMDQPIIMIEMDIQDMVDLSQHFELCIPI